MGPTRHGAIVGCACEVRKKRDKGKSAEFGTYFDLDGGNDYHPKASPSDLKDMAQLASVTAAGVSTESYAFDTEGRVSLKQLTLTSRSISSDARGPTSPQALNTGRKDKTAEL